MTEHIEEDWVEMPIGTDPKNVPEELLPREGYDIEFSTFDETYKGYFVGSSDYVFLGYDEEKDETRKIDRVLWWRYWEDK